MTRPKIKLGRSLEEKMEQIQPELSQEKEPVIAAEEKQSEVIKSKKSEIADIAREKMEAMARYDLRPKTISGAYDLTTDDDINLTIIAKKRGKAKQELVAEYVLECLERDMKKIGIFEHKK